MDKHFMLYYNHFSDMTIYVCIYVFTYVRPPVHREGFKAPGRAVTSTPAWVSRPLPLVGQWGWSVGEAIIGILISGISVMVFMGYVQQKWESAKLTNKPITDAKWFEHCFRAIGYQGGWLTAAALFFYARNQIYGRYFGVPVQTSLPWHKYLGATAFALYTAHGILAGWMYHRYKHEVLDNLSPYTSNRGFTNFFGCLSWACMLFMFIGALEFVRRRKYVVFIWSHQLWMPALLFAVFHAKV